MDPAYVTWPGFSSVVCTLLVFMTVTQAISWWLKVATRLPYPPGPKPKPLIGNMFDFPLVDYGMHYLRWGKEYKSKTSVCLSTKLLINRRFRR
jgi:hypothetical protein